MTLRLERMRAHPEFPWLDAGDPAGVQAFLAPRGWLEPDETIVACERAGEGNMNLTLRVRTDRRSVVLKQARPWVEKYDHIEAPWDRSLSERWFYERVAAIPAVAAHMPRLLASDPAARVLLLEDLTGAVDLTDLYAGQHLAPEDAEQLGRVLRALHDATANDPPEPSFNRAMRALNHAHCFVIPLERGNGIALDGFEAGLGVVAARLAADAALRAVVDEMGQRQRWCGGPLLHGDYFPGSWLRTAAGLRIIDPEFCFQSERELDVGCAVAHLVLARQEPRIVHRLLAGYDGAAPACDAPTLARYTAIEIIRRVIGVAQLPIASTVGWRADLLDRARAAALDGTLDGLEAKGG